MENLLLTAGVACVIAAIVGGGLSAFGTKVPVLKSWKRQLLLGVVGALFIATNFVQKPAATKQLAFVVSLTSKASSPDGWMELALKTTDPTGAQLTDARIKMSTNDALSALDGGPRDSGSTNDYGIFRSRWRATGSPPDGGYRINIVATKDGFADALVEMPVIIPPQSHEPSSAQSSAPCPTPEPPQSANNTAVRKSFATRGEAIVFRVEPEMRGKPIRVEASVAARGNSGEMADISYTCSVQDTNQTWLPIGHGTRSGEGVITASGICLFDATSGIQSFRLEHFNRRADAIETRADVTY